MVNCVETDAVGAAAIKLQSIHIFQKSTIKLTLLTKLAFLFVIVLKRVVADFLITRFNQKKLRFFTP